MQVISLISVLLGKKGTGADVIELKKRRKKIKEFVRGLEEAQTNAVLTGKGFKSEADLIREFQETELKLPEMLPILLTVPPSVVDNWHYEISLWGHFSVAVYRDMEERDEALKEVKYGSAEVSRTNYLLLNSVETVEKFELVLKSNPCFIEKST